MAWQFLNKYIQGQGKVECQKMYAYLEFKII